MDIALNYWWVLPAYLLFAMVWWFLTWVVYLANMAVNWSENRLLGTSARLARGIKKLAAFMSTSLNWMVFTALLIELPRERYLSTRLMRHYRHGQGWRQRFAGWIGRVWLDPFDPTGNHL